MGSAEGYCEQHLFDRWQQRGRSAILEIPRRFRVYSIAMDQAGVDILYNDGNGDIGPEASSGLRPRFERGQQREPHSGF